MKSRYPALVALVLLASACQPAATPEPPMETELPPLSTRADSVAFRALEASGGEMAMRGLPYLRFNFGSAPRMHLWDKMTGDYRLEYVRNDTATVVLFNIHTRQGQAFKAGQPAANADELVERGYSAFINDTYWLLMPTKMLDQGVYREMVPDSSSAEHDVVRLSFENVGLTPGDAYYVWVNKESGRVDRWHYVLQSGSQQACAWQEYKEFPGPMGPVTLSESKACQRSELRTDGVDTPAEVPADAFTDPAPMLLGA